MDKIETEEQARKLLARIKDVGGCLALSKILEVSGRTVERRQADAHKILSGYNGPLKIQNIEERDGPGFTLPVFPDAEMPFEQLLREQLIPATQKRLANVKAKEWFPVNIKNPGPFMYLIMGDQHLDDNYCNLDLLLNHVELAAKRKDVYVLPMGDLHNNWVGRLERLYVNQNMTKDQAYAGIKWFLRDAGLQIPIALLGNHDVWNDGARIVKEILSKETLHLAEWAAKFKLVCPNGREVFIDAAHDHKGHSMYNATHAQKRAALFGRKAHAFIGAHRHTPGFTKDWWGQERITTWYIRAGSYKWFDQHAVDNSFPNYQDAPAIAMIIDPETDANNPIVFVSDDVNMAVNVLDTLKAR